MLVIISPAKTQDFSTQERTKEYSEPSFLKESTQLVKALRKHSPEQIAALMSVSDQIAALNYNRFKSFKTPFTPENAKQALLAFKGDVYTDIDVAHYTAVDFKFAQQHLRILSGLYGLLRPLDLIQPYRLEMKIKLSNSRGKNLYEFWGDRITKELNAGLDATNSTLINLASAEYFKAVNTRLFKGKIITPIFKDHKNGDYKIIAFYAKRARGMMTDFIIKNKIQEPEQLKIFQEGGYTYNDPLSNDHEWVFTRH